METLIDRINRLDKQNAAQKKAETAKVNEREQAIIDRHVSEASGQPDFMQKAAKGMAELEIEARRKQREYADQAPQELYSTTSNMLSNLGSRGNVLDTLRQMTPEQRAEALKLAPGIAQQLGDDRGGGDARFFGALSRGISHMVSQPTMELVGSAARAAQQIPGQNTPAMQWLSDLGGTPEEIEYIRQLDAAASQEFNPALPSDPWYERGPLQATEMAPWMATVVGGGGLGRTIGTGIAETTAGRAVGGVLGRTAAQGGAKGAVGSAAVQGGAIETIAAQGGSVGLNAGKTLLPGLTGARVGELAGITGAAFPGQYAQEVDQLKAIGMKDDAKLRLLAGGTAAVVGLIEGLVPNPLKAGPVPLNKGAVTAARQYLWEAAKRAPAEMSEEYLQGVTSGLGQHVAQYIDANAKDKTIADAFALGWEQTKEAALPMAFLLGVPAVGGAGRAALQARTATQERLALLEEVRSKGFVSINDAANLNIEGKNRKERLANLDKNIEELRRQSAWNDEFLAAEDARIAAEQGQPQSTPTGLPEATQATQVPSTPPSGTATPPVATQPGAALPGGEAGAAVAGAGRGIVDGLYQSMYERLQAGQYPGIAKTPADDAVAAEHARQPFQTPEEIRQFVNDGSRPIQEPSQAELTQEEAAKLIQERIAQRRAGQKEPPASQPVEQPKQPAIPSGDIVAGTGQGPMDVKGTMYREDPNARTPSERLKTRQAVDPSEGVVLVTKDQWGKPIPEETQKARQEFVDNAKPGAEFGIKGFETSGPYRVMDDGQILDTKTGRVMGDVQSRANQVNPGDITWSKPVPPSTATPAGDAQSKGTAETPPTATVDREWQPTELPKPKYPDEVDALPKDSLYRTTAGGKEFIAVRGVGKRGGGDQLFKTVEEANAHIERQKIIDQQNEEVRKKREEREAAEAKKESDYVASFQGFKQDNPREFGRARKVLDVQRNYRDKVQTRKQIIEQSVADGANVIDGRLERPDGTSLGEDAVTKIGIQYAEHLIAARLRSDAAKAELRGDNEMSVALNRQADLLVKPESKWQAETRAKLDAVPALKGSKFDMDEEAGTVKVTRPDDIKVTIHFKSDEKIKEWGKKKGFNPEKTYGWAVKTKAGEIGIFVRSDANHTNVLNHEMMHALEFAGIVTKEEVEKYGGREGIAEKYGKWAEAKYRKKDSVFQRIYDALEAVFSSQRKFFEEVGERKAKIPSEMTEKERDAEVDKLFKAKPETPKTIDQLRNLTFDAITDSEQTEGVGKNKGVTYRRKTYEVTNEDGKQHRYKVVINDRDNKLSVEDLGRTKEQEAADYKAEYESLADSTKQRIKDIGLDDLSDYQKYDVGLFIEGRTDGSRGGERSVNVILGGQVRMRKVMDAMGVKHDANLTWKDVYEFLRKPAAAKDTSLSPIGDKNQETSKPSASGFAGLPSVSRSIFETAMQNSTPDSLLEILHSGNKNMRSEFELRTGIKLPATVKGTKQVVEQWFKDGKPAKTTKPSANQVNVDSGAESKVKPEDADLEAMIDAEFDAQLGTKKRTSGKSEKSESKADTSKYGDTLIGRQFAEAKAAGGDDTILFFRMGDFYELYFEDAQKAARILGLTLVTRDKSAENPIPMAGFPYHQIDGYLQKLKSAGFRVAVNEAPLPPKRTSKKEPSKPKTRIRKAADNARQEADSLWAELNKQSKDKLTTGLDPDLAKLAVRVALAEIKAGTLSFAAFVEKTVAKVPAEMLDKLKPYMEMAWKVAHKRGMTDDPAGKFDEVLAKKPISEKSNETGTGTDGNERVEDGTRQPDRNESADGNQSDGVGEVEGDTGQSGDRVLSDSRPTKKDKRRGGGKGDGTGGRSSADKPDAGPGDTADAGAAVDDGPMGERPTDHVIAPEDDIAVSSLTKSLERNIKALEILKALESEGRLPDEAERKALAQYTGWGGLSQALDSIKGERMLGDREWMRDLNWEKQWGKAYLKLKELLTKEEFQKAQDSTENAHYTSKTVIQSLWKIAERLGYKGGRVLELGAGIGHFAGLMPSNVRGSTKFIMVELDSVSSRIAKMLYPNHEVFATDMAEFKSVPGSVTMGIGNVPFAGSNVEDANRRYGQDLNLHNYAFARHLDAVAPGGIVVAISTHNTLDSNIKQRQFLATKGDLIGAIRLPNDAFAENAKTQVVTDILIFRRPRQGEPKLGVRIDQNEDITVETKDGREVVRSINKYFIDNPQMVLGVHSAKGSMYGADEYTVESTPGGLQAKLDAAIDSLPLNVVGEVEVSDQVVSSDTSVPFGRLEIQDGKVVMGYGDKFVKLDGQKFEGFPVHLTGKTGVSRAKDYIELRDLLADVRNTMLDENATDEAVGIAQQKLSDSYNRYVEKHGPLNYGQKTNIFVRDPDYYRVLALENERSEYNPETKKIEVSYTKAAIFTQRVLGPQKEPQSAGSPADAMSLSIAWRGAINSEFVGKLLGVTPSEAETKLLEEGLAFRNPSTTELELADLYLSGNVRTKLAQAQISADEDPQYRRNVEALEKVLPAPITLKKDTVRLGATWVPESVINAFATQAFGTNVVTGYNANTDAWSVGSVYGVSDAAKARYKTGRVDPEFILAETLNLRSIKVYDRVETGEYTKDGKPKTTQVLNEKETQAAKHRASVLRADFEKWVMENPDVSQLLAKIYNEKYNNFVRTKYNGDFLVLPGANPEVKLRPYQKSAIWRILNRGTSLLAHAVGSGKTYTMIGAAMEMKRLGLARRPLLVVQNATLGQFATSFQKMYPNANILVANKEDLGKGKRQLFLNKISTGNWDAVVMAQSTFDNMASDPSVERAFIQDQLDLLEEAIREEGGENAGTPTVKQLVRTKKSLKKRFDDLIGSRSKKEDNVTFEELGADALFLDEAHAYKKPTFTTKLSQLVGLNTEASARSLATTIKVRSIQGARNGRNVILATGTPVTNTLGEAWHMVNYVSPATNAAFSSRTFDQFIANFAQVDPTLTMNAGGQYVYKDAIVKFRNGHQLVEYINDSWDIVTPDQLRAYMEQSSNGFPTLRNGQPTAITVDRTPGVANFMDFIDRVYKRFKALPAKERRAMSFIPALAYGASKAATLDIRLVNPNAAEEEGSKLQHAADEIKRIYDESMDSKGTQLFFSDMKNPFSMSRLRQFMGGETIDAFTEDVEVDQDQDTVSAPEEESESDSFLYQELKKKLLKKGIPAEQIAFAADAKTDKQRQAMFERVNNGDIRVLIGSTAKMGVGVNVQKKLVALHHFDTPWLPADLEQREGRILRFGNENETVDILRYAMKKTLDGAIYMATARKQKFIWQVLNGQLDGDSFEDPSSAAMLSIEEQLAAIQDDPLFFEKIEVQNRLRELELERQSFYDSQQRLADSLSMTKSNLRYQEGSLLPSLESRAERIQKLQDAGTLDKFSLEHEGNEFTDSKKASEHIKSKVEEVRAYILANFDSARVFSQVDGGLQGMPSKQKVQFTIGPATVVIAAQPMLVTEKNDDGKDVTKATVRFRSKAYLQEPNGLYEFYDGTATTPLTFFEKAQTILEDTKSGINDSIRRSKEYREKITELERLLEKQWEDQEEYDQKKERLSEIEQQMLQSKGTLGKDNPTPAETKLSETLTRLGQYVLPGMSESVEDIDRQDFVRKYSNVALDRFWQWSNKDSDAQDIRDAIESLSSPVRQLITEIYSGKFNFIEDVQASEVYGKIRVAASESELEERIIDSVDAAAKQALEAKPEKDDGTDTDVLYQNVDPQIVVQATDLAIDAQDAGIESFDELVAFSVKAVGEQRTRDLGQYLAVAGDMLGLKGIRPIGDVIGMPGVSREQAMVMAKAAFPMLTDEQIEAGLDIQDATAFGRDQVGFAPLGTPAPGMSQSQRDKGNVKGWTQFISATRAIIGATSKADVSTFIHELFHPMRKFLLDRKIPAESRVGITDEDIKALEDYAGAKDGKWTVEAEEKAAKAWEQYWYEGKSPTTALRSLFEKLARWMREVYRGVHQITGGQLPPEVRQLFDKIVQRGGISEQEMPQDDNLTSIKNEVMNDLRAQRGLPELADVAAQTQQEWIDTAESRMRAEPGIADRLVKAINANPRNLSNIEVAILQLHYRHVNNELAAVSDRLFEAKDAGDALEAAKVQREVDLVMNALAEIEDASKAAGREWGRAGVSRQIVLRKDFSLAGIMRKARIANAGNALSAEQQAEMIELAKRVAELEGKLAKAEQEKLDLERQRNIERTLEEEKKRPPVVRTTARKKASDAVSAFKQKFASVFSAKSSDTLLQTEDELMAEAAQEVVEAYVKAGVFSFGEFIANVQRDAGELPTRARVAFATAWEDAKMMGEIPTPDIDVDNVAGMTRLARRIQRSLVEAGITDREKVVDAVHESLQELVPDITRRETMDALSGYGQYSKLSQADIDKTIRDINGQLQQLAKLEDMRSGQAPSKTGGERRTPSDEERRLIKEVNEAKRRGGFVVTDPQAQLRTAMDAAKTAVRNRIADITYELTPKPDGTYSRIVRSKTELIPDAELEQLRKRRDALLEVHKTLFPKPGATMEQRIAAANRAIDASIADLEERLKTGNVMPIGRKEPVSTPELEAKRARLKALQEQRDAIRALANPKMTPEERSERAYKASLLKRLADYQERMVNSEFTPSPKRDVRVLTPEQLQLKKQLEDVKDQFFQKAAEYRLANMSPVEKAWDYVKETSHLSRAIMTSFDLSAVFRQGGVGSLAHPVLAAETSREMLRAMMSSQAEFDIAEGIRNDPMYQFAMTAKLAITEEDGKITRQEEAFMGRWARHGIGKTGSKVNVISQKALAPVAMSARAYTTFLNGMRFKLFKHMVASLGVNGQVTADEAKVIAQYVNVAAGRADLGKYNQAMANLNVLFFAPRYVASRFQFFALPFYLLPSKNISLRVKKTIALEYARYAIGLGTFLATAVALGSLLFDDDDEDKPTVEFDPRSSDFGKVKIGETRIDPMSGFSQVVTVMSQVITGRKKGADGEIQHLRGEGHKWGSPTTWDVMASFARKKFAPIPSAATNVITGENVVGDKVTPLTATRDLFIPLSVSEVKETMQARGVPAGSAITILTLLGMGGGTYGPKTKFANGTKEEREQQLEKDLQKMDWDSPDLPYRDLLNEEQYQQMMDRREERKQDLAYAATALPVHNKGQSKESFEKEVAAHQEAMDAVLKAGWSEEFVRQLLRDYAKTRGNKEAVVDRIRRIKRIFSKTSQ